MAKKKSAKFGKASEIKVGVVGYGGAFNMGKAHLAQMQQAGMTPVAVAEIDKDRLKVAETDFPGIDTFTSLDQMLKKSDVNLIVIITPHNTHAKLALQALKAGRHVVCEKPLAITTAECDRMINEAKKRKLVISTYHNRHWDGCILEAVHHIKKKKAIGDVFRVEACMGGFGKPGDWWRSSKSISGGILYDWGVHLLEYSLQILDGGITEVSAYAKTGHWGSKTAWKDDTNEDEACAMVRFDTGAWLSLSISSLRAAPPPGWVVFHGTKGAYLMDHGGYEIITPKGSETIVTKGRNRDSEGWRFYQNVADHLVKGTELVISGEWSRRPIHILDLADTSTRKGQAQKAKYK